LCAFFSHWLGLYHTFEGGCSAQGDKISDTPQEAQPNFGCKPSDNRNTCPTDAGNDPINNFMDYSDDVCLYQFTAGQATSMKDNMALYRTPATRQLRSPTGLSNKLSSTTYSLKSGMVRSFTFDVPSSSSVTCKVTSKQGNVDLFMNWDGDLAKFDCSAETSNAVEVCSLQPSSGTAHAFVLAVMDRSTFEIVCETA